MTVIASTAIPTPAPRGFLKAALLGVAVLVVSAAFMSVRSHPAAPLHALAQDEHRLAQKLKAELAKEYRAIRPADTDSTPPPIPPSETWPAQ